MHTAEHLVLTVNHQVRRRSRLLALTAVTLQLLAFGIGTWPQVRSGVLPGFTPDTPEYVYGAKALLGGTYLIDIGGSAYAPRYAPGFPLLLTPAVAFGSPESAVWVAYLAALLSGALIAVHAWRAAGPWGAPLAMGPVLFTPAFVIFAQLIMSDLPALAIALLSAVMLVRRDTYSLVAAGVLAGFCGMIRPALFTIVLAGCIGLWRVRHIFLYLAGAAPVAIALAVWQWRIYGSPAMNGYVAAGATDADGRLFALHYILGEPYNGPRPSNLEGYSQVLFGFGGYMLWPGFGLLGLVGLAVLLWLGRDRVFARFAVASVVLLLAVHLPYFWQSERFLFLGAALLSIGAAFLLVEVARSLVRRTSLLTAGLRRRSRENTDMGDAPINQGRRAAQ